MDIELKNVWRTSIFPEYKDIKSDNPFKNLGDDLFDKIYTILNRYGIMMTHEKLEADDVAYLCVQNISSQININIITSDKDYLQMLTHNNVKIFNGGLKELKGDPYEELWLKILAGDKSDNIPSICGKVKAKKLMKNEDELNAFVKAKNLKERLELNKQLIDMKNIPEKYQKEFIKKYNFSKLLKT